MPGGPVLVGMKSIVQDLEEGRCYVCGSYQQLELHHIMHGTANRRISTRLKLVCLLCRNHHTGQYGVHRNAVLDTALKEDAQRAFERTNTREEWMKLFKKNYL